MHSFTTEARRFLVQILHEEFKKWSAAGSAAWKNLMEEEEIDRWL
ncbi:MAG: hypothetical protein V4487_03285 [Chlamydiota bacterium]